MSKRPAKFPVLKREGLRSSDIKKCKSEAKPEVSSPTKLKRKKQTEKQLQEPSKSEPKPEVSSPTKLKQKKQTGKQLQEPQDLVKPMSDSKPGTCVVGNGSAKLCCKSKFVGAHMSVQGGLQYAVYDAVSIGARAFGLFLRSQRQWVCKPLLDETVVKFKQACKDHMYPSHLILPHGSYLINSGAPNPETLAKSRDAMVDELKRCERLGLTLYNFHPGSSCGEITTQQCLQTVADSINYAHKQTKFVITVVENMSCQGNTVGGKFEELAKIIDLVEDKSRIGVCLDTCHAFAAGFDLSTESGFQKMIKDFEEIVGFKYLKAVHVNDSKGKVGCHLDRHENIGKGHIGKEGFRRIMKEPCFNNIPMILETPLDIDDADEVKLLYGLCCGGKTSKN